MAFLSSYKLTIETKAPVFIGSGQKISKKEYIHLKEDQKVLIPDLVKLVAGLAKQAKLDSYEDYLMGSQSDLFGFFIDHGIASEDYSEWMRYGVDCADVLDGEDVQKEIFLFTKDAFGNPYIPGSSLKGAIRTAVIGWSLIHEGNIRRDLVNAIKRNQPNKYNFSREARELEVNILNKLGRNTRKPENAVNDELAGVRISDSRPLSTQDLVLCQKIDMKIDGQKNSLNIFRECLKPGIRIEFDLTIDERLAGKYTSEYILGAVRGFYDHTYEVFQKAYNKPRCNEPYPIYLGGGSGYPSKTVTYPLFLQKKAERLTKPEITKAVEDVSKIINNTLSPDVQTKHKHLTDKNQGASPHTLKCTKYEGAEYQMGLCNLKIEKLS